MSPYPTEHIVEMAIRGLRDSGGMSALDELATPVYATDAQGVLIYHNDACLGLAGRTPEIGEDRWCVTWRIYQQNGQFMPHDQCPMAVAIKERRPVRGVSALAERPDGTRVRFTPYPTPILNDAGELVGAVNVLVHATDAEEADFLRGRARQSRRLSQSVYDQHTVLALEALAVDYEADADKLSRRGRKQPAV